MKLLMLVVLAFLALAFESSALAGEGGSIPPDTTERFTQRYRHFIRKDERKAFDVLNKQVEKLDKQLDKLESRLAKGKMTPPEAASQRAALEAQRVPLVGQLQELITAFWTRRDPDPATPENEFKQRIDGRINDIEGELFFSSMDSPGLLFSSNGGYHSDMAKVYLLHGAPDGMTSVQGRLFVPLMLWLYADYSRGNIRYAFLFYQRSMGGGPYKLFDQDAYQMDMCAAVNEIAMNKNLGYMSGYECPETVQLVYRDLFQSTPTGQGTGQLFAWALMNFSQDFSIRQGDALAPPVPAAQSARESGSRISGSRPETTPGTDAVLAACPHCATMIPARMEFTGSDARLFVARNAVDWTAEGEALSAELILAIVVHGPPGTQPLTLYKRVRIASSLDRLSQRPDEHLVVSLFKPDEFAPLPSGGYRISVYLKGTLRNRYNAWELVYAKP